jgi:hypothetical protein
MVPAFKTPESTFPGPGNPLTPPSPVVVKPKPKCKKGFTRKKSKCVRTKKARKSDHKKGKQHA